MIIVSQDKESIINFNNVIGIMTDKGVIDAIVASGSNGESCAELGKYKTQERAKEVLQEIIKEYKGTEAFKVCANRITDNVGAIAIEQGFVYEMPLE